MRTILFKALRADGQGWVEGFPITFNDRVFFIRWSYGPDVWDLREEDYVEVTPETVCQFTGLTDKNGKKAFDGDKISNHTFGLGIIIYSETDCAFEVKWEQDHKAVIGFVGHSEITGSIHDKTA